MLSTGTEHPCSTATCSNTRRCIVCNKYRDIPSAAKQGQGSKLHAMDAATAATSSFVFKDSNVLMCDCSPQEILAMTH